MQVLPDAHGSRQPPWYWLQPSYWLQGRAQKRDPRPVQKALARPAERDDGLDVDGDVTAEAEHMRARACLYVAGLLGGSPSAPPADAAPGSADAAPGSANGGGGNAAAAAAAEPRRRHRLFGGRRRAAATASAPNQSHLLDPEQASGGASSSSTAAAGGSDKLSLRHGSTGSHPPTPASSSGGSGDASVADSGKAADSGELNGAAGVEQYAIEMCGLRKCYGISWWRTLRSALATVHHHRYCRATVAESDASATGQGGQVPQSAPPQPPSDGAVVRGNWLGIRRGECFCLLVSLMCNRVLEDRLPSGHVLLARLPSLAP